jgi:hypothetical protein
VAAAAMKMDFSIVISLQAGGKRASSAALPAIGRTAVETDRPNG